MKHIKTYKIFESIKLPDGVSAETIEEICYEITDDGRLHYSISYKNDTGNYILISLVDYFNYNGFKLSEISDCVLRLRTYLGFNFKRCSVAYVGYTSRDIIDLNKLEDDSEYYDVINISNIAIFIK